MLTSNQNNIDKYISRFPKYVQELLEQVRSTIKKAAPEAEEAISYQMPAFKQNGVLVYFAAYKKHIGLYPSSTAIHVFKNELATYKIAKGSIQFPLNKPLPLDLISRIVVFRIKENIDKAELKSLKTKKARIEALNNAAFLNNSASL